MFTQKSELNPVC